MNAQYQTDADGLQNDTAINMHGGSKVRNAFCGMRDWSHQRTQCSTSYDDLELRIAFVHIVCERQVCSNVHYRDDRAVPFHRDQLWRNHNPLRTPRGPNIQDRPLLHGAQLQRRSTPRSHPRTGHCLQSVRPLSPRL